MKNTELTSPEFNLLVTGFERELIKANKSEKYAYKHTSYVKEFLSYAEENQINYIKAIDQSLINNYVLYMEQERMNYLNGSTLEEATISGHKIAIRAFWKYLESEQIKINSIKLRQKKSIRKDPTTLTHEEIKQLYSVCDTKAIGYRDKAMISLYYGCGLRKSEGLRLLLTDIDCSRGRLHIRKSKNNRERYVMMTPKVQQHIEEYMYSYRDFYLAEQSRYEDFFIGERGCPINIETITKRIEALWNRVKDRYGTEKRISCHDLRHTIGTHLYMAKMDIEMIALMLGHQTLEATQLYIHSANTIN